MELSGSEKRDKRATKWDSGMEWSKAGPPCQTWTVGIGLTPIYTVHTHVHVRDKIMVDL